MAGRADEYFAVIPERLLYEMNPREVMVYGILRRHADDSGQAWPSRSRLAKLARMSVTTIDRALRELRAAGWITYEHRISEEGQRSNLYFVRSSPEPPEEATGGRAGEAPPPRDSGEGGGRADAAQNESQSEPEPTEPDGGPAAAADPEKMRAAIERAQTQIGIQIDVVPDPDWKPKHLALGYRRRDLIWEAVCEIWGDPASEIEEGRVRRAVRIFREAEALPDEIEILAQRYMVKFPTAAFTALAVAGRVGELRAWQGPGPSRQQIEAAANYQRRREWRNR